MRIYLIIILSTLFFTCSQKKNHIQVCENGSSNYQILIGDTGDSLTLMAAKELQQYLFMVTGYSLPITQNRANGSFFIIIDNFSDDQFTEINFTSLQDDAFFIGSLEGDIYLSGNSGKTRLYATYTFLENYVGCRYLNPGEEWIPQKKQLALKIKNQVYQPAFAFRKAHFPAKDDIKYRFWHKLEETDDWGMFVHTFEKLVPPDMYFDQHPEYFSLVNGKRLKDGQLCLSNESLLNLLAENLNQEIAKNPDKKIWSVSQNDCYNYCECEKCRNLYEKYESISGAYVKMANFLARKFPNYTISTLAYQFTRSAPINIKPDENVNIMFCSIECNRSMPLAEDIRSTSFVKDMQNWSALTNNIFMWDYVVQFKNFMCPFPNFHVLQPNIQFFQDHKVNMMFQQGSGGSWSDLSELKQYLIAKLLWNPSLNTDSLINDFMHYYYGSAAPLIREYFDLTHQHLIEHKEQEFLNIYGFPMDYRDSFLSHELLKAYKNIMDMAEEAVMNEPIILNRVKRARLAVDFAYLDIALNDPVPSLSYYNHGQIDPEMTDYLQQFVNSSSSSDMLRINERNFQPEDYQEYVLNKLKLMSIHNLASDAEIILLTEPSEKYPVGGATAMADGRFGDLDFHNNWLGFEGSDMIAEITFKEKTSIKQIRMNFLKAVNSWVFLPEKVIIEASSGGDSFFRIGTAFGDNTDRNYLVKSIPFVIPMQDVSIKKLKITAISMKECPEWHRGFGKPSWIFIDEIVLE